MKLPSNTIVAPEKIKKYLLTYRIEDDKSQYLEEVGYSLEQWKQLEEDFREQILCLDAMFKEMTAYGDVYEIRGILTGPNGKQLKVVTI